MAKDPQNNDDPIEGEVIAAPKGGRNLFKKGESGNPTGRPKGSKNKITVLKLLAEEEFRNRNAERLALVLDQIVDAALDGDKSARKLVWDAIVSKSNISEDKTAGNTQQITVHHMEITQQETSDDEEQTDESREELE